MLYFVESTVTHYDRYKPECTPRSVSDGVYAIAITLLIIDIKIYSPTNINCTAELWNILARMLPSIGAFVLSFVLIFISWVNHYNVHKLVNKSSMPFVYANAFVLLTIVVMPFPASLLGDFILTNYAAPAVFLYNAVLAVHGLVWICNTNAALNGKLTEDEKANAQMRISRKHAYLALIFYALLAIISLWFPITAAIFTTLTLIFWLFFGTMIKTGK